jgi:hypothetical protein
MLILVYVDGVRLCLRTAAYVDGVRLCLRTAATSDCCVSMESRGWMILTGEKQRTTCPRANLSTTNTTWNDPGVNLGLCGERLVTDHLNHGTAMLLLLGGVE